MGRDALQNQTHSHVKSTEWIHFFGRQLVKRHVACYTLRSNARPQVTTEHVARPQKGPAISSQCRTHFPFVCSNPRCLCEQSTNKVVTVVRRRVHERLEIIRVAEPFVSELGDERSRPVYEAFERVFRKDECGGSRKKRVGFPTDDNIGIDKLVANHRIVELYRICYLVNNADRFFSCDSYVSCDNQGHIVGAIRVALLRFFDAIVVHTSNVLAVLIVREASDRAPEPISQVEKLQHAPRSVQKNMR